MELAKLKELLSQKIDTQDKLVEILEQETELSSSYYPSKLECKFVGAYTLNGFYRGVFADTAVMTSVTNPSQRWWMVREWLRYCLTYRHVPWSHIGSVVYSPWISGFPHVSIKDPQRIAYTASIEDGERDTQRIVTLSRFLRSREANWKLKDEYFAEAEAALRAELTTELLLLPSDFIPQVYENGPSSCMRYTGHERLDRYWKWSNLGCHALEPLVNAPGFRIAVTRSKDGEAFSQRAVVWDNPNDPTDKRYIRIYGSGPLQRRLESNGYSKGSFAGTKLKMVRAAIDDGRDDMIAVVCPYLDSNGTTNNGEGVMLVDGELHIISPKVYDRLSRKGFVVEYTSGTDAYKVLKPYTAADLEWTDSSGNKHSYTVCAPVSILLEDGTEATVADNSLEGYTVCRTLRNGLVTDVYCKSPQTFRNSARLWLDNEANRAFCGYIKLDEAIYPEMGWFEKTYAIEAYNGKWIRTSHVCRLYQEDGTYLIAHVDHVPDRKKYKRVRMVEGKPTLVRKTMQAVEVTLNRRAYKGIPGVHPEIVKAENGKFYHCNGTERIILMGSANTYVPSNWEDVTFTEESERKVREGIRELAQRGGSQRELAAGIARNLMYGGAPHRWYMAIYQANKDNPKQLMTEAVANVAAAADYENAIRNAFYDKLMATVLDEVTKIDDERIAKEAEEAAAQAAPVTSTEEGNSNGTSLTTEAGQDRPEIDATRAAGSAPASSYRFEVRDAAGAVVYRTEAVPL